MKSISSWKEDVENDENLTKSKSENRKNVQYNVEYGKSWVKFIYRYDKK